MVLWAGIRPLSKHDFFVPETGGHRISGSYDLFPQHCLLPTMNPTQHVKAVHEELRETIMALPKKRRQRLQKSNHEVIG